MRRFADHNPAAVTAYFLAAAGIAMFSMDPAVLLIALAGAVSTFLLSDLHGGHGATIGLFLLMTFINPLVSHNGVTVLLVINHNPITLEALCYGAAAAGMVVAVLYFFRTFSHIMTSDRLLYVLGRLSPKLALVLSMALRYVPLFSHQARKVQQAQRALGLYQADNVVDGCKGGLRVFSIMTTWALEMGVITADSMTARGYGTGRRTQFALFRWTGRDSLLMAAVLLLTAAAVWGTSARAFSWYPAITAAALNPRIITGYISYALLTFLPAIDHGKEAIRWRCLTCGM